LLQLSLPQPFRSSGITGQFRACLTTSDQAAIPLFRKQNETIDLTLSGKNVWQYL